MTGDLGDYRRRVRTWLEANAEPKGSAAVSTAPSVAQAKAQAKEFMARMYDAGYAGITWPAEYGGQGLTQAEERIFIHEAGAFSLPVQVFGIGLGMCGPTLISIGSEEQKRRFLRPLLRGEEIWCQLFSEPGAGSDVASLQTRAVRDGDEWVVTGQKVWTSLAQHADLGLLIARTDPDVPKHEGITMFVIDMHAPGVTVRPLRDMGGRTRFNEVFFEAVRVGADRVVGKVDGGWQAAIATLLHERVSIGTGVYGSGEADVYGPLAAAAVARGLTADPVVRDQLVELYLRQRALTLFTTRLTQEAQAGIAPGARGAIAKLLLAELILFAADLAGSMLGPEAVAHDPAEPGADRYAEALALAPGGALGGGTNEIMRNIIGDRVLGLPREPQVDRDVPFRRLTVGTQKGAQR